MSDAEMHDSLLKADQWSKVIGIFFALGVYLLVDFLTGEATFSTAVAAFAGIGIRFYIPYQVSITYVGPDDGSIQEHPASGEYHHGAAGLALIIGAAATATSQVVEPNTALAFAVGTAVGIPSYFLLRRVLKSA